MVSIAMGSSNPSVTFSYDELGRRVKKTVTQPNRGGNATTTYLWCGQTLCMAQYGGGATRRYVAEGEVYTSGGTTTPYYYGPDQLGSVRDVLNAASGAHLAHYDYDTYGLGIGVAYGTVTGTSKLADYTYAGMLYKSTGGISLATYRSYDPQTAWWQSRDPIGEIGGINLYQYVGGSPLPYNDPLGLCPEQKPEHPCREFSLAVAVALLDFSGIFPGGNDVAAGLRLGAGIISAGIAAYNGSVRDGTLGGAGLGISAADAALGTSLEFELGERTIELTPVVGNVIAVGATFNDLLADKKDYKECFE